jgi:hypothetical protein
VAQKTPALTERQLQRWGLIEVFLHRLTTQLNTTPVDPTWSDPKRQLQLAEYLGLFLLGLLNPVVKTMRALCAASQLERVQEEICARPVSLGSFSEAQAVVDPQLLHAVYDGLLTERQNAEPKFGDARLKKYAPVLTAVDSTLWHVLPRMSWAVWRHQSQTQRAARLHVKFRLLTHELSQAALTPGRACERAQWRRWIKRGEFYVGDRYFGEDYRLLGQLPGQGCSYVVRLRQEARWTVEQELELSAAARAAGGVWQGWVRLGHRGAGPRVRLVQVAAEPEPLYLVTNVAAEELAAELIALIYRYRWPVELFFRWLKCILGCRHWLAESEAGVTLQVYLALIAAQLLLLSSGGRRPNRRQMELIQMYLMGWARAEELVAGLARLGAVAPAQKS